MRRTTAITLICAGLLAGVILGRLGYTAGFAAVIIAPATALLAVAARSRLAVLALVVAAAVLGLWHTTGWLAAQTSLTGLIGQKITLTAVVADDPAVNETSRDVSYSVTNMTLAGGRRLPGTLAVYDYPVQLQRGYKVALSGKITPGYGNAAVELSFPKVQVLSRAQSLLERWRQRFFAGMRTALPDPLASFGLGLLVGIRALIPKPLQTELALVGLSHLVAVSGYNLTIIVQAAHRLLARLGRGPALVGSLWVIAGFLVFTGATASIVRASLVSVLTLLAGFYGHRFQPLVIISIAAGLTAAFNPSYLTDIGWLLSFLAFFGILVLAPAVEDRLGHPRLIIVRLLIESMAAQILTLPLIMFFFNQLSIVSPLTNFLILPLVPLAMGASFLAGLGGMVVPAFAGWVAWPAALVLNFMLGLINYFAARPWAARSGHLSLPGTCLCYGIIVVLTVALTRTGKRLRPPEKLQIPAPVQIVS